MRPSSCVRTLAPLTVTVALAELSRRLLSPRGGPPPVEQVSVERYFSAAEMQRGKRFTRPQVVLALAREALALVVLAGTLEASRRSHTRGRKRVLSVLPRRSGDAGLGSREAAQGAVMAVRLTALIAASELPLTALGRRRAMAVGLITQSWRGWAGDLVKATAIECTLSGLGGGAVVALVRRYPRHWWLPASGAAISAGALLGVLAPVLLDPLFNRFAPLPEGSVREDVLNLARAADARIGEVYCVDASRRTTGANAYVSGLGPTKRMVLFDTLLSRYERDEVRVVVAHELAHLTERDTLRSMAFGATIAAPAALAVQRMSWCLSQERRGPQLIPALALAAAIVLAPISIIAGALSRAVERRADLHSLELSDAPEAFVSLERKIALQNVVDVDPPRWRKRLLASHPPTLERIGIALAYAERNGRPKSTVTD